VSPAVAAAAEPLSLDFSHEAMTPDPLSDAYRPRPPENQWLAQRTLAWGGSEVGALLTAYGLAPANAILPAWVLAQTEHYARLGVPKLVAWKAGLRARPGGDKKTMSRGAELEKKLLGRFRDGPARYRVQPRSIRHASTLPQQFLPFVDRVCHRLAVTPDAWARALDGELCMIELKCSYKPLAIVRPPWHYRCQLQAEMAVCGARYGLLVVGEQWVDDTVPDGPVRVFAETVDAPLVELLRVVAVEGWRVVEALRSLALEIDGLEDRQGAVARRARKAAAERCGELWAESIEHVRAFRDPTRAYVDAVLEEIPGIEEILARQCA